MKISFRTPRDRPPIFQVGDDWYIDLTFGFGEKVEAEGSDVLEFLASTPHGSVVVARRLTPTEVSRLLHLRLSSDHETAAVLLPDGKQRWGKGSGRSLR